MLNVKSKTIDVLKKIREINFVTLDWADILGQKRLTKRENIDQN